MGAEWVLWEAMPRQSQRCTGRNVCEGKQGESRERQSKSLDCGAGLTPVNGRGQAGGVGRKRLRPCSSETVSARLKRLQDCPWWSLIIATAMLSQDWGCPRRVRHTEGTVPAPRSLASSPLTQWRQRALSTHGWCYMPVLAECTSPLLVFRCPDLSAQNI